MLDSIITLVATAVCYQSNQALKELVHELSEDKCSCQKQEAEQRPVTVNNYNVNISLLNLFKK